MAAIEITPDNWESEVLKSDVPVLVDFGAAWCGPCQRIAPIVEELAGDYDGRAKIATVDVDQNQALAQSFGVMSVPTLKIFKGGEDIQTWVGFTPKAKLAEALDGAMAG